MRRTATALLVLPLAAALALPAATGAAGAKTVKLEDFKFAPKSLTVTKGTVVTFKNLDRGTNHNVTSAGAKRFKSSKNFKTGSYKVTFRSAGTFKYSCTLHPLTMKGKVVVK